MKVVVTPRARVQMDHQLSYGIDRFGHAAAESTFNRVEHFLLTTLAKYPRTGRCLTGQSFYESYIPRTLSVVIYRIDHNATRSRSSASSTTPSSANDRACIIADLPRALPYIRAP